MKVEFENIIDTIQSSKKKGLEGQFSMFDLSIANQKEELEDLICAIENRRDNK